MKRLHLFISEVMSLCLMIATISGIDIGSTITSDITSEQNEILSTISNEHESIRSASTITLSLSQELTDNTTFNALQNENVNQNSVTAVETKFIECDCDRVHPSDCEYKDVCLAKYQCYAIIRVTETGRHILEKGCLDYESPASMMCRLQQSDALNMKCCDTTFCNRDLDPVLLPDKVETDEARTNLAVIIIPSCVVIAAAGIVYLLWRKHKKRMKKLQAPRNAQHFEGGLLAEAVGDSTLWDMMTSPCSSGSGSGLPVLVHRTVARQIQLVDRIGKGRYGEVWRGIFHGESVAVKVFSSRDEDSFNRETDIYNTVMLRHKNILGYIASDRTSRNSCTELWLICYYHPIGSLYEYLQSTTLNAHSMLKLCLSAANGLSHLHMSIAGVMGKPAIAHRDVKSKNILVKCDFTCCIADLGLSVLHKEDNSVDIKQNNNRVGTKRYMSPEVLDETINASDFDSFKQADVYAFALVLWEIGRRALTGGIAEEYRPPFYDVVGHDPSFEEMRKIVCDDNYRPVVPNRWHTDETMSTLTQLINEMWTANSSSRLTMLRVKKTLMKAKEQLSLNKKYASSLFDDKELLIPRIDKGLDSTYAPNLLEKDKEFV